MLIEVLAGGGFCMEIEIIYSKRRTVTLSVKDGKVVLRAPKGTSRKLLLDFVKEKEKWINDCLQRQHRKKMLEESLTDEDIKLLKKQARVILRQKLDEYSKITGLKYGRMKITSAKGRFGSCSSTGTICFSYRLMLYPEEARDYVVLHELCHLVHMNHSADFYALVARYMPDYKRRRAMLKMK